ncbi:MAG: ATP-dependent protease ATPase subunit HslU [Armatimonadetes bacterium]|nr:ATP-dependent protease ATPase subunit HslU [Armatimonadota bacterium]
MTTRTDTSLDRQLEDLTPPRIVAALDKYIVGQTQAKRSVAVALRNRMRRQLLPEDIRDEVIPKNILMIGPTGVGKTEIARRLAKLVRAPFIKVEASKYTEVGYVGRDVDSMVRDLVEASVRMVRSEKVESVRSRVEERVTERLLDALQRRGTGAPSRMQSIGEAMAAILQPRPVEPEPEETTPEEDATRDAIRRRLLAGELDKQMVEIEVEESRFLTIPVFSGAGMEEMGMNLQDMLGGMFPKQRRRRTVAVADARRILLDQEAERMIDMEQATGEAVQRAEQSGIIFIDEMDKIAGRERAIGGPDVSREGVQRGLLPIVEGSTVMTKYGPVQTDHILFIAAGAFHTTKPSDLIPELQGRFPLRVELSALGEAEFVRILNEPENSLIRQYTELMKTEGVELEFTQEGVAEIARMAAHVNEETENIGARRLHTVMERLLEQISFEASDIAPTHITITADYVNQQLADVVKNLDLTRYIL